MATDTTRRETHGHGFAWNNNLTTTVIILKRLLKCTFEEMYISATADSRTHTSKQIPVMYTPSQAYYSKSTL